MAAASRGCGIRYTSQRATNGKNSKYFQTRVAFFTANQHVSIPHSTNPTLTSRLFQQLAPINTWDKTFFVPVTIHQSNRVRIMASQNNTNIIQIGGTLLTDILPKLLPYLALTKKLYFMEKFKNETCKTFDLGFPINTKRAVSQDCGTTLV